MPALTDAELTAIAARCRNPEPGSHYTPCGPVTFACMDPDARELMDRALAEYRALRVRMGVDYVDTEEIQDRIYAFAYWLFRHSGMIDPHAREDAATLLAEVERLKGSS